MSAPKPPAGLNKSGRALWHAVLGEYELDEHERAILTQACRLADLCDQLQGTLDAEGIMAESSQGARVHPAAVELRQQGIALARLMTALRIPAGESTDHGRTQHRPGVRGVYGIGGGA
ncbi:terminase [Ornithinimicrobium cryptoxanthini]|uniref:terminase n=1 Tax=Ornithinimicrobium cryptoxanthini TaxID=2934161 RepID=UPI0021188B69|nr:terminase [Ornithinimicrobium cryptoxanthini]